MNSTETDIVKKIDNLKWARLALILASFVVGLVLVKTGQVRAAFFVVGGIFLLAGLCFPFAAKAAMRSVSAKSGKTIAQLNDELLSHHRALKKR